MSVQFNNRKKISQNKNNGWRWIFLSLSFHSSSQVLFVDIYQPPAHQKANHHWQIPHCKLITSDWVEACAGWVSTQLPVKMPSWPWRQLTRDYQGAESTSKKFGMRCGETQGLPRKKNKKLFPNFSFADLGLSNIEARGTGISQVMKWLHSNF